MTQLCPAGHLEHPPKVQPVAELEDTEQSSPWPNRSGDYHADILKQGAVGSTHNAQAPDQVIQSLVHVDETE
jgi:hypothetical protein